MKNDWKSLYKKDRDGKNGAMPVMKFFILNGGPEMKRMIIGHPYVSLNRFNSGTVCFG